MNDSFDDQSLIQDFLAESRENLDRLDQDFVALEAAPGDRERIASIFRTLHTLKGSAAMLNFPRLATLSHAGESVLAKVRDENHILSPSATTVLFQLVDAIRNILKQIEEQKNEGEATDTVLLASLEQAEKNVGAASPAEAVTPPSDESLTSSDLSLRVNQGYLDSLLSLSNELTITRNNLLKGEADTRENELVRLQSVSLEIQQAVLKTRLQSMSVLWRSWPRRIRDLAVSLQKQVHLVLEGENTELDKTILDLIQDPLTHLVRNALDHGLETPSQRKAVGKSESGRLVLRAKQENGQILIEVEDDGAGINWEKVRQRAIDRGFTTASAELTETDLRGFLFRPGFSTTDNVTSLSGRGVGLDVVQTQVHKIGGRIDIETQPGQGTLFRLRVPLSLALWPLVRFREQHVAYALPQQSVREVIGIPATHVWESYLQAAVYRYQESLLPVVFFSELIGRGKTTARTLIVLNENGYKFGLAVEAVEDQEDGLITPLPRALQGIAGLSGCTTRSNGEAMLILDVPGLAERAGLERRLDEAVKTPISDASFERRKIVLVEAGPNRRWAIPIEQVERLEVFSPSQVEQAGSLDLIRYHDGVVPLVSTVERRPTDMLHVVICPSSRGRVGFVVNQFIDVLEESFSKHDVRDGSGFTQTAVIQNRITEVVQVDQLVRQWGRTIEGEAA